MRARDRRALWVLGLWALGIGFWVFCRLWWARQDELRTRQVSLGALSAKEAWLAQSCAQTQAKRKALITASRPAWLGLPEDQLRLRFQGALLGAAQKAGLQEVRLRTLPPVDGIPIWRMEAVGLLTQWMEFVEGTAKEGLPLDLRSLHWAVNGDPWASGGGEEGGGPLLRGESEWGGLAPQTAWEAP